MFSRTDAVGVIARQTGVPVRALTRYAGLVDAMLGGPDTPQDGGEDGRPVTARWLVLLILAIGVGDANGLIRKLKLLDEASLQTIYTSHDGYMEDGTNGGCTAIFRRIADRSDVDLGKYGLTGSRLTQLLEQLVDGTSGPIKETFKEFFCFHYHVEVTWSCGRPSAHLEVCEEGGDLWTLTREYWYETPRPPDTKAGRAAGGVGDASIPRNTILDTDHFEMLAEVLNEARRSRSPVTVH